MPVQGPVNATVLEQMVVNLLGNSAPYEQMLEKAVAITKSHTVSLGNEANKLAAEGQRITEAMRTPFEAYNRQISKLDDLLRSGAISQQTYGRAAQQASDQLGKLTMSAQQSSDALGNVASSLLGSLAPLAAAGFAIQKTRQFLDESFVAYGNFQKANIVLDATLTANNRNVAMASASYAQWADAVQHSTTVGRLQAITLVTQSEQFGLTGDQAKKAAEDAISLGAATGRSADSMIRLTQAMAEGDVTAARMFQRMVPSLRSAKTESEFLARYSQLVAAGQQAMGRETETAAGKAKQASNAWDQLEQNVGKSLGGRVYQESKLGIFEAINSLLEGKLAHGTGPMKGGSDHPRGVAEVELGPTQTALAAAEKLNEELDKQITLLTRGAHAAEMDALAKGRLTEEQLSEIRAKQAQLDLLKAEEEEEKKAAEAYAQSEAKIKHLTEALEEEAATLGLTADQIKMHQLQMEAATQAELDHAEALSREKEEFDANAKLMVRVAALRKEIMTDEEKRDAAVANAADLWKRGVIGIDEYNRAVELANEKLNKHHDVVKRVSDVHRQLHQELVGSAAASTAISDYLLSIGSPDGGKRKKPAPRNELADRFAEIQVGADRQKEFNLDMAAVKLWDATRKGLDFNPIDARINAAANEGKVDPRLLLPGNNGGPGAIELPATNELLKGILEQLQQQQANAIVIEGAGLNA
jgi:hypothetical protein